MDLNKKENTEKTDNAKKEKKSNERCFLSLFIEFIWAIAQPILSFICDIF